MLLIVTSEPFVISSPALPSPLRSEFEPERKISVFELVVSNAQASLVVLTSILTFDNITDALEPGFITIRFSVEIFSSPSILKFPFLRVRQPSLKLQFMPLSPSFKSDNLMVRYCFIFPNSGKVFSIMLPTFTF